MYLHFISLVLCQAGTALLPGLLLTLIPEKVPFAELTSSGLRLPGGVPWRPPATGWQQSSSTTLLGPGLAGSLIRNSYLEWVLYEV